MKIPGLQTVLCVRECGHCSSVIGQFWGDEETFTFFPLE